MTLNFNVDISKYDFNGDGYIDSREKAILNKVVLSELNKNIQQKKLFNMKNNDYDCFMPNYPGIQPNHYQFPQNNQYDPFTVLLIIKLFQDRMNKELRPDPIFTPYGKYIEPNNEFVLPPKLRDELQSDPIFTPYGKYIEPNDEFVLPPKLRDELLEYLKESEE